MKKINREGIRALILETLDEMSLGEAKKKKVEEADEDMAGKDPHADVATGMNNPEFDMSDEEAAKMSAPAVDVKTLTKQFQDAVQAAIEARQTNDTMKIVTAEAAVKFVLDQVKDITGDNKKQ